MKTFHKNFSLAIILFALMLTGFIEAQSTTIKGLRQITPQQIVWTVAAADFDSLATIWSPAFVLNPGSSTFDAQGSMDLGAITGGKGYSTVVLLWGSVDDGNSWQLCDSLGTITAATATKLSVDLDDFDVCPVYKLKVYNAKAENSFVLGLYRE